MAVASLVLGIVGLFLFVFFIIPNVLAVVFGFVALSQIGRSGGTQSGRGLAIAGLVTAGVGILFFILLVANSGNFSFHMG
jgi:hypothetical protein